jgi:sulfur-carrier protein
MRERRDPAAHPFRLDRRVLTMPMVRIPSPLHPLTGGVTDLEVTAATVREVLAELDRRFPGFEGKLLDTSGAVKPFIRIYVGPDDISALSGLDTDVRERDEIAIIPAIAGGRHA